jgi:hypothetical protein
LTADFMASLIEGEPDMTRKDRNLLG